MKYVEIYLQFLYTYLSSENAMTELSTVIIHYENESVSYQGKKYFSISIDENFQKKLNMNNTLVEKFSF